jgi:CheY-like chemotaxis protein
MDFCFDHWEWEDPRLRRKIRKDPKVTDGGVPRRKVNYAKTCAVILIPSRLEYSDAGIDLWYDKKDLKASQHQASAELKRLIEENPALTMESAMAYLYQPSVDVYFRDNSNSWSSGGILNVLVVDKNPDTAEETIKLLRQYQKRWDWNTNIAQSGEKAIKTIKSGTRDLDVVFIDENIGRGGGLSFAALMTIFRSVYGEDVFIGCTLSEGSEQTRKDAIKAGCDFMWQRPFQALLDMLPVILSSRSTKRSRQNSLGNSRNSSSGGLSSISPEAAASLTRSGSGSRSGSVSGVPTPNSTSLASSPTRSNSASPHGLLAENIHYVHGTHTSGDIITSSGSPVDNMLAERLALAGCGCSGSSSSGACGTSHSEDIHSRPPVLKLCVCPYEVYANHRPHFNNLHYAVV